MFLPKPSYTTIASHEYSNLTKAKADLKTTDRQTDIPTHANTHTYEDDRVPYKGNEEIPEINGGNK